MKDAKVAQDITAAALAWHNAGCSIIPIRPDGTKRPGVEWKTYMDTRAQPPQIEAWYRGHPTAGIGIVCGKISGNLEMLELEGRACSSTNFDKISDECYKRGIRGLWQAMLEKGYAEWTPNGGLHFLYRITDHDVPGNTKVARRPATEEELAENPKDRLKVLAETRGEGGYVVAAPTGGQCHPTGDSWSVAAGTIGVIHTISWEKRQRLVEAVHAALDEMPPEPTPAPRQTPPRADNDAMRPGDDFNQRATWEEILEPSGWRIHSRTTKETYWTRPGKKKIEGHSATTGRAADADRLYVFSSSTEFTPETPYDKFSAWTLLEHGGDFSAAARALRAAGYGAATPPTTSYVAGTLQTQTMAPQVDTTSNTAAAQPPAVTTRDHLGLPTYRDEQFIGIDWDGIGVAREWARIHQDTFAYLSRHKHWMMWQGDRWARDDRERADHAATVLVERMRDHAKRLQTSNPELAKNLLKEAKKLTYSNQIQSILRSARSDPRMAVAMDDFDKDPNLVTVDNGVINLQTLQLQPHDPKLMLTRKMNAAYQPNAPTGRWNTFIEEILPDPDVRNYVQRVCGYMLQGQLTERVMFLIHGESGTGKTQFLEAIHGVMGDFAGVAPASAFQPRQQGYKGPSEDLHKLMGKRFVIQSELDAGTRLNESLVKSIVGADTQTTRALYGEPVDWQPEYTVFMATNYLPRISSSDNAIWNRVKPIRFGQVFIDEHGQTLDPQQRNLGRRLAKEEPHIILNWLLEGLAAYRQQGLNEPTQIATWLREYRDDVDTTRQFLTEAPDDGRITIDDGQQATVREVYRAYHGWAQDNGVTPVGMKTFNERLLSSGWKKEKREKGIMWQGIGLTGFLAAAQQPTGRPGWWQKE